MPAYNSQATLKETFDAIPKEIVDEIILVDDCSNDKTVDLSNSLGIKTSCQPLTYKTIEYFLCSAVVFCNSIKNYILFHIKNSIFKFIHFFWSV